MAQGMEIGLQKAGLVPARASVRVTAQFEDAVVKDILASPPNPDTFGARPCMDNKAFVFLFTDIIQGPTLIRDEYILASRLIEERYAEWLSALDEKKPNKEVVVITGQPSCGKTVFNRLLQVQRISQRKKMIYTWSNELYFFDGTTTWSTTNEFDYGKFESFVKQLRREIWVLYDSRDDTALQQLPSEGKAMLYTLFSGAVRPLFSIFTASPTPSRWKGAQFGIRTVPYYMMPWSKEELQKLDSCRQWLHLIDHEDLLSTPGTLFDIWNSSKKYELEADVEAGLTHFEQWGPIPRLQINWLGSEAERIDWEYSVQQTIQNMDKLEDLRHFKSAFFEDRPAERASLPVSHKIFRVLRKEKEPKHITKGLASILRVSPVVIDLVVERYYYVLKEHQNILWSIFREVNDMRQIASKIFERMAKDKVRDKKPWSLQPVEKDDKSNTWTPNSAAKDLSFESVQLHDNFHFQQSSVIEDNTVYFPASQSLMAADFFARISGQFYAFSVFDAKVHDFNPKILEKLQCCFNDTLPEASDWHIVFIVPESEELKVRSTARNRLGVFGKSSKFRATISHEFDEIYEVYRHRLQYSIERDEQDWQDADMQDAE